MAYYVVRAELNEEDMATLADHLRENAYVALQPFGQSLTKGLRGMRRLPDGRVAWEEEDYCTPPLRMEREAVLDEFFTNLEVEHVAEGEGWAQLKELPASSTHSTGCRRDRLPARRKAA